MKSKAMRDLARNVSMRNLASAVGATRAAIYYHMVEWATEALRRVLNALGPR